MFKCRSVAQGFRVHALGAWGRRFDSYHSDHLKGKPLKFLKGFLFTCPNDKRSAKLHQVYISKVEFICSDGAFFIKFKCPWCKMFHKRKMCNTEDVL